MDLAEGSSTNKPSQSKGKTYIIFLLWALPYFIFTGCLLFYAGRILMKQDHYSKCECEQKAPIDTAAHRE